MGVRLRSAVSPVTPAIIGSRRPRHRIGLKAPPVRFQPAARSNACAGRMWMAPWSHLHGMRTTHSRPLHTCSRGRAGTRAGTRVALGSDDRDAQLWRDRPRASPPPGSGSRIRQRRPPEPADRPICAIPTTGGGDTSRRTSPQSASPPREERRRLGSRLPDLVPTYARPGPSTAAKTVDLAAAIAQEEESGAPPARSLRDERDHRATDDGVIASDGTRSRRVGNPDDRFRSFTAAPRAIAKATFQPSNSTRGAPTRFVVTLPRDVKRRAAWELLAPFRCLGRNPWTAGATTSVTPRRLREERVLHPPARYEAGESSGCKALSWMAPRAESSCADERGGAFVSADNRGPRENLCARSGPTFLNGNRMHVLARVYCSASSAFAQAALSSAGGGGPHCEMSLAIRVALVGFKRPVSTSARHRRSTSCSASRAASSCSRSRLKMRLSAAWRMPSCSRLPSVLAPSSLRVWITRR